MVHRCDDELETKAYVKPNRHSDRRYYRSPSRKRSSCYLKPDKFNGTSCFETFLVQFQNCTQFNHWTNREKLHYLRWSLTGDAAQMLWATENMTY